MRISPLVLALVAALPVKAQTLGDALLEGKPLADIRLRYNTVEQSDKARDAEATTVRARLGYQTAPYRGLTGIVEFDLVQHLGAKHFNDTTNGMAQYPIIPDPDVAFLNRLQLDYAARFFEGPVAGADTHVILGRQAIIHSDLRYIGNSNWRQHDLTYDALTILNTALADTVLSYSYLAGINRTVGPHNPAGYFDSSSHLFNAVYRGIPHLKLEGFAYLLDFDQSPALSSATYGMSAVGNFDLGDGFTANMVGTVARQSDYGRNPHQFGLGNYRVEGGLGYKGFSTVAGYEILEGDGTEAFQTPLGTGHLFQGWAEMFTNKPPEGVTDSYAKASYTLRIEPLAAAIVPSVAYHDFSASHVNADYGSEWDAGAEALIGKNWTLGFAYADYQRGGSFPDKREMWTYAIYHY